MKRVIFTFALLVMFAPLSLGAQTQTQTQFCSGTTCNYTPLEPLPGQTDSTISTAQEFGRYLNLMFSLFIIIGGMFAVMTFVWGGITYMVSDIVDKKDFARKQMQRSIWGILILLGSYILLYTINPELIRLDRFNPTTINRPGSQPVTPSTSGRTTTATPQPTQQQRNDLLSGCPQNSTGVRYDPDGAIVCF